MDKEKEINVLYKSVSEYLKSRGGKAVLATGVCIIPQPSDKVYDEFIVGVKICGKIPEHFHDIKSMEEVETNLEDK